ncbi:hypothetical protein [Streptomyces sp. NPDC056105]|uniref:hypothetical protein n=1 Tax=Streptomyces sp. NPDC056105 TaxID=3345714 RepID=UPI0035D739EE
MSWTSEEMTACASRDILVIPGGVLGRACRAGLLAMEPSAHLVLGGQAIQRRSGPGMDQLDSPSSDIARYRRSGAKEALYRKETKNLLVSYSAQKLGFF